MPAFDQYANNIDLHMEYKSVEIWKSFQGNWLIFMLYPKKIKKNSAQPI